MNITFFITDISHSGGTERMTISLSNELVKYGHNVHVVSLIGNGVPFYDYDKRIRFHVVMPQKKSLFFSYPIIVFKLRQLLRETQSDFVVDVVTTMSLFSIPSTLLSKTRVITWEHFNFSVDLGRKAMRVGRFLATKFSYAIVVLTDADRKIYLEKYKCHAQVCTISNFLPQFPALNYELASASKTALAVGRITKQKGFDRLIEIWKEYKEQHPASDWKLKIVGDGEDKHLIESLINQYDLNNSVSIIPPTRNINQFYESAAVFLLTSRWEGLPMVLIESQAYGIPSVAYNCKTGPAEVIDNGVNGYLIEDGIKDEFVKYLALLLDSHENRMFLSQNARQMAMKYSAENVVQKWISLFNNR